MRTWLPALAVLTIWFLLATTVAGAEPTLALLFTLVLFALPGIPLARAMTGGRPLSHPLPLLAGILGGVVLSALLNASLAAALGWSAGVAVVGIVVLTGGLFLGLRRLTAEGFPGPSLDRSDHLFLAMVILPMLISIAIPLSRVGYIDAPSETIRCMASSMRSTGFW